MECVPGSTTYAPHMGISVSSGVLHEYAYDYNAYTHTLCIAELFLKLINFPKALFIIKAKQKLTMHHAQQTIIYHSSFFIE